MWIPRWLWERYRELRLKIGLNDSFSFKQAKGILSYDSDEMIYKTLNKLEQLNIIAVERAKKDKRAKTYKVALDLKDLPYSGLTIPSDYQPEPGFLRLSAATGSMATLGTAVFPSMPPSRAFEKMYDKESERYVTIMPEKPAGTIEEYLASLVQEYKSPEAILTIIKKQKIDFDKAIKELNSYQRRYLGALLEVLDKHRETIDKLYELTKKDKREFSIFPRKVRQVPKEYKEIAKKWRINLNIDVVNVDEL